MQDSERAHSRVLSVLSRMSRTRFSLSMLGALYRSPELPVNVFGLDFPNPVGVAAGMDKNGAAVPSWQSIGYGFCEIGGVTLPEEVESEGVTTAHIKVGGYEIELLEPMGKDTPVGKFIDKKGPGIHHLALEVDDIEESLAKAKRNGLEPIGEAPRPGADNTLVAFFHPKDTGGVLLEIVQCE